MRYLTGNLGRARRHLRPPGSHSKELAKTISLQSAAILIWQPDSITRRKNCFSRHQQSSGNYLNCVMIMPQSSGESFTFSLPPHSSLPPPPPPFFKFFLFFLQATQEHLRSDERREINSSPPLVCLVLSVSQTRVRPGEGADVVWNSWNRGHRVFDTQVECSLQVFGVCFGVFCQFEGDKCTCSLLPPPEDGCLTLFGPALIRLHLIFRPLSCPVKPQGVMWPGQTVVFVGKVATCIFTLEINWPSEENRWFFQHKTVDNSGATPSIKKKTLVTLLQISDENTKQIPHWKFGPGESALHSEYTAATSPEACVLL